MTLRPHLFLSIPCCWCYLLLSSALSNVEARVQCDLNYLGFVEILRAQSPSHQLFIQSLTVNLFSMQSPSFLTYHQSLTPSLFCIPPQYIVRSLSAHGAIDAYLEALIFVLATLTDAMEESQAASREHASNTVRQSNSVNLSVGAADGGVSGGTESAVQSDSYVPLLSQRGRCALHALTYMLPLLRKLVQRDLYLKSPVTTSMTDLTDDLGPFQMHELLYRTFSSIGKSLLPAFKGRLLRFLPSEVQQEWIGIMRDLICSLQTPLPPATPFIHSPSTGAGTGGSTNVSLNQVRHSAAKCVDDIVQEEVYLLLK